MTKFRPDGGFSYQEAMQRVREVETREELARHVAPWHIVEIKPYGITERGERDHRNGWLTHVVIGRIERDPGTYVIGFTDGPL